MTILVVEAVTVLAFYERVSGLDVEGFADDAGDAEGVGEGVDVGDAAPARSRQSAAGAFAAAVVGRSVGVAFIAAGN